MDSLVLKEKTTNRDIVSVWARDVIGPRTEKSPDVLGLAIMLAVDLGESFYHYANQ